MATIRNLIAGLLILGATAAISPFSAIAADVLQCVPYARNVSGVQIRGDAWTWWDQAKGRYKRGHDPRPGAVLALANSEVMPLGHVAVVSRVLDERHILLRHANWSGPGVIERDVLAVDSSEDNDWSQVRIWWGQTGNMGARDNPVNGFIYPEEVKQRSLAPGTTMAANSVASPRPQLVLDLNVLHAMDKSVTLPTMTSAPAPRAQSRTLADIIADVKRTAKIRKERG